MACLSGAGAIIPTRMITTPVTKEMIEVIENHVAPASELPR